MTSSVRARLLLVLVACSVAAALSPARALPLGAHAISGSDFDPSKPRAGAISIAATAPDGQDGKGVAVYHTTGGANVRLVLDCVRIVFSSTGHKVHASGTDETNRRYYLVIHEYSVAFAEQKGISTTASSTAPCKANPAVANVAFGGYVLGP